MNVGFFRFPKIPTVDQLSAGRRGRQRMCNVKDTCSVGGTTFHQLDNLLQHYCSKVIKNIQAVMK